MELKILTLIRPSQMHPFAIYKISAMLRESQINKVNAAAK
jgi:hypothetical protein